MTRRLFVAGVLAAWACGASLAQGAICIHPGATLDDTRPRLRAVKLLRLWQTGLNTQLILMRSLPQALQEAELNRADGPPGAASDLLMSSLVFESGVDLSAGRLAEAEDRLKRCADIARARADRPALAACSNNLGVLRGLQSRFAEAADLFSAAERTYSDWGRAPAADQRLASTHPGSWTRPEDDQRLSLLGSEVALLNRGNIEMALGQYTAAEAFLGQAATRTPACGAAAKSDLARLYRRAGRLASAGATAGPPGSADFEFEPIALGGGPSNPLVGTTAAPRVPHVESVGARTAAALLQLQAQADREIGAGQWTASVGSLGTLVRRAIAAGRPDVQFSAHAQLMRVLSERGLASTAVLHGKLAVNLVQEARRSLAEGQLPLEARRSLLRERRGVYTQLAELLIAQDRLGEAESTLKLSKEDEGRQFQEEVVGNPLGQLPLLRAEAAAWARYDAAAAELQALDGQRREIARRVAFGAASLIDGRPDIEAKLARMADDSYDDWIRLLQSQGPDGVQAVLLRVPDFVLESFYAMLENDGQRLKSLFQDLIDNAGEFRHAAFTPDQVARLRANLAAVPRLLPLLVPRLRHARTRGPSLQQGGVGAARPTTVPASPAALGIASAGDDASARAWPVSNLLYAEPLLQLWKNVREVESLEARQRSIEAEADKLLRSAGGQRLQGLEDDSQALLAAASPGSAILYYVSGPKRLSVLLVDRRGRRAWSFATAEAALGNDIEDFLARLRHPGSDPLPLAKALYDRLIAPLADTLRDHGVDHIVLSLPGRLRFVPFAALHDGDRWLGERIAISVYVGGRLESMLQAHSPRWSVAAFGATTGGQGLSKLPGVKKELEAIMSADASRRTDINASPAAADPPSQAWLDAAFSRSTLQSALAGRHSVLHIASHFVLERGDPARSFLLLGDGSRLNLSEITGPDFRFDRIEQVTLSACETALNTDDSFGQEVDGLGALLMGRGARTVVASLWTVNDESTATLMSRFYAIRSQAGASAPDPRAVARPTPALTKAEALRRAQVALIERAGQAPDRSAGGLASEAPRAAVADVAPVANRSARRSHPYYWAPFVLMGNWL